MRLGLVASDRGLKLGARCQAVEIYVGRALGLKTVAHGINSFILDTLQDFLSG